MSFTPSNFPADWYWLADGRVFASARGVVVDKSDAGFQAFCEKFGPSQWPADDAGAQTADSLNAVVMPYGLSLAGPVRLVAGTALVKALDKSTKVSTRDLAYIGGRTMVPETSASVARIAQVDGSTPKAWFDAAAAVTG